MIFPMPAPRRAFLRLILAAPAALAACFGGAKTVPPTATSQPSATAIPPSPTPAPTQPPPSPTPFGSIQFNPAQIGQGGYAIVYLNEAATAATLTFKGRQYAMLSRDGRWWALVGIGALEPPGLLAASVSYVPPGKTAATAVVQSIAVVDRDFPVVQVELDATTASLLAADVVQNELATRAAIFSGYTTQRLWSGPFRPPSSGAISSVFGEGRSYNRAPVTDYHRGTDFLGEIGAPVSAAAAGRVVFTRELAIRGNSIIVDHGAGLFTGYHHLSEIGVREGDAVSAGQRIGAMGSTGLATGPHLHWEVVIRGVEVDGKLWLEGKEIGP
jgi:hypothetical protein